MKIKNWRANVAITNQDHTRSYRPRGHSNMTRRFFSNLRSEPAESSKKEEGGQKIKSALLKA